MRPTHRAASLTQQCKEGGYKWTLVPGAPGTVTQTFISVDLSVAPAQLSISEFLSSDKFPAVMDTVCTTINRGENMNMPSSMGHSPNDIAGKVAVWSILREFVTEMHSPLGNFKGPDAWLKTNNGDKGGGRMAAVEIKFVTNTGKSDTGCWKLAAGKELHERSDFLAAVCFSGRAKDLCVAAKGVRWDQPATFTPFTFVFAFPSLFHDRGESLVLMRNRGNFNINLDSELRPKREHFARPGWFAVHIQPRNKSARGWCVRNLFGDQENSDFDISGMLRKGLDEA
jgi:hypothetical protein